MNATGVRQKAEAAIDAILELETELREELCGGNALEAILDALRSIKMKEDFCAGCGADLTDPSDVCVCPAHEPETRACRDCRGAGYFNGDGHSLDTKTCGSCGGRGVVPV